MPARSKPLKRSFSPANLALALAWAALGLLPVAAQTPKAPPPPPATPALEQHLVAAFGRDQDALLAYLHREDVTTRKDDKVEQRTDRVWYTQGRTVTLTLARDGHPLADAQLAVEQAHACEREQQNRRRPAPPTGELEFGGRTYSFAKLAHDYVYGEAKTITWQGRPTWVYQAEPNPAVEARSREEKLLLHSQGEIYVDAEDQHVVRIAIHSTQPVRYALGLIAVIREATFLLDLQRISPGVWLPSEADFHLRATVLLFDHLVRAKHQRFYDYSVNSAAGPIACPAPTPAPAG